MKHLLVAFSMVVVCAAPGCDTSVQEVGAGGDAGGGGGGGNSDGGGGGGGGGATSDLPCDVLNLLQTRCNSCHGSPTSQSAPMSLVTRANLLAPAKTNPQLRNIDVSITRMQSMTAPMPPAPAAHATSQEIAILQAWVTNATPVGSCSMGGGGGGGGADGGAKPTPDLGGGGGGGGPDDPLNAAPKCSTGISWFFGNSLGDSMNPGLDCNACHKMNGKEIFAIAGTVYKTGHEPDKCMSYSGIQVVITDANGTDHSVTTNVSGNFTIKGTIPLPYRAKVVYMGKERAMLTPQTEGSCNGCHTDKGTSGAPGRVTTP